MGNNVIDIQGLDKDIRYLIEFLGPAFRLLGLGQDIYIPSRQLGRQPHILAATTDSKRKLFVRNHYLYAVGRLVHNHLGNLGGGQRVNDKRGGISRPLYNIDLLALQFTNHRLNP